MSVSLTKGGNVSLTKEVPGLTEVAVALGWDQRTTAGADFDLDASAIMTGDDEQVLSEEHFVFYNSRLKNSDGTIPSPDGSILHTGDNLTGEGEGDDETINVDLPNVPQNVTHIFFPVSIYDADNRHETFGDVKNAYIRVVDKATGKEITRYDLKEDASGETAMVFGELYRKDAEWKFRAIGQGYASGLKGIAQDFGVHVG